MHTPDLTVWILCQQQSLYNDGARSQAATGWGVQKVEAVTELAVVDIARLGKLTG